MNKLIDLINKLETTHSLKIEEYEYLIKNRNETTFNLLKEKAVNLRKKIYQNTIYIRGLIEISNICKNNCLYCGIRKDNKNCERYRLTENEILECCEEG